VNAWWAKNLPDEGVAEIFAGNPSAMVAAAFHPPQRAVEVPGGFRLTGRSPLASIVHDCDRVLISAFIYDGDKPRMTPNGPAAIAAVLNSSDVEIVDTWYTLGMRGTDSNDVAFNDVFAPTRLTFPLDPTRAPSGHFKGPLYRYPASAIIALFSCGVLLATARGAINEFRELAINKTPFGSMKTLRDRSVVQATVAEAEGILRSARALFYQTYADAWAVTVSGQPNSLEQRADLMLAAIHVAKNAAQVTELMHRLAGTSGIYARSRLDRHFRDAHTLRHHGFVSENKLETVGQVYLGLPPDFPLIVF
jgi:alkylation response protein AidB-like acyl-CoA dehydrogenase